MITFTDVAYGRVMDRLNNARVLKMTREAMDGRR